MRPELQVPRSTCGYPSRDIDRAHVPAPGDPDQVRSDWHSQADPPGRAVAAADLQSSVRNGKNGAVAGHLTGMAGVSSVDPARRARFAELFGLVFEPLQAYVLRRGGGSDTDDIVAEALTVLWRRLDDIPDDAPLAWAFGVARRCLSNHRRSATRLGQLVERLAANPAPAPTPNHDLDDALACLDPDQREILRLWAWEGLAPRDIAVAMNISANAASIRLHRARRELSELLESRKIAATTGHTGNRTTEEHR